jgi:hypothetical protein
MRAIFPLIVLYNFITSSLSLTEVQRSPMIRATFEPVRHEMKGKKEPKADNHNLFSLFPVK